MLSTELVIKSRCRVRLAVRLAEHKAVFHSQASPETNLRKKTKVTPAGQKILEREGDYQIGLLIWSEERAAVRSEKAKWLSGNLTRVHLMEKDS